MPNPILYEKNCMVCGEKYEAKHNKSKYCSIRCKNKQVRGQVRGNATNEPQAHGEVSLELWTQLFSQLNEIREELSELIERVDILEENSSTFAEVEDVLQRLDLIGKVQVEPHKVTKETTSSRGNENDKDNDTEKDTKNDTKNKKNNDKETRPIVVKFSLQQVRTFESYEEAKKKGGYYDPEQGFISSEDIPVPDGYEAFLLTKE